MADIITIIGADSSLQIATTQFTFDMLKIPTGVHIHATQTVEAMMSRGVDGTIYRSTGRQFKPFVMSALKFHATFAEAVLWKTDLEFMNASFLTIQTDNHGTHENVYCQGVSTVIRAGEGVGAGVTSGGAAFTASSISVVLA